MQEQKTRATTRRDGTAEETTAQDVRNEELAGTVDEVLDSIDDVLEEQLDTELLDFIDDALEENAEEFVKGYVQQGGE